MSTWSRNCRVFPLTAGERTPDFIDLEVTNPNVDGVALRDLPFVGEAGVVFSRLLRGGKVTVPEDDSVIQLGDGLRLVGPKAKLLEFEPIIGRKSSIDIKSVPSELTTEHLYVTKREVLGKSLGELNFERGLRGGGYARHAGRCRVRGQ